ncbi:DMT family transporter [Glacieibacterium frigidum]|uniref:DMT family transporter n=1 Tax=Glacieibacterium frigidum TaxID=2593303 RepID=A0A552UIC7_9SPHN|nr:DMT family transporter [Glacieibacterium frigidum]TRW17975.1 DMT family transporter [Glacieibacterium frigidum]
MSRALPYLQAAGGVAALCALDAAVKHLTLGHALLLVVFGRYATGTVFALAVWQWQGRPPFTREMLVPHLVRGVLIALTATLFFYAIHRLPLAEAITLSFTAPLMIPPLAQLFIGEKMRGPVLGAAALGFVGVMVTVQGAPSFSGERLPALAAILAASLTYALSAIAMRSRAALDGATRLTLSGSLIPLALLAPFAVGEPFPAVESWGWFAAAGLFGNLGIQLLARAYAEVEVQVLGVLEFTALFWAALFGWLLFDEGVRPQVWLGAAIIASACLLAARSSRKVDGIVPVA